VLARDGGKKSEREEQPVRAMSRGRPTDKLGGVYFKRTLGDKGNTQNNALLVKRNNAGSDTREENWEKEDRSGSRPKNQKAVRESQVVEKKMEGVIFSGSEGGGGGG